MSAMRWRKLDWSRPKYRALRKSVYEKTGYSCACCFWTPDVPGDYDGTSALIGRDGDRTLILEVDHIVPHSRGGSDRLGNLQPLCSACNASKGARSNIDYVRQLEDAVAAAEGFAA